jgi:hypothetical protein
MSNFVILVQFRLCILFAGWNLLYVKAETTALSCPTALSFNVRGQ